ncbi:hypothetical protein QBC37DRAFT_458852 [Rhypophila decipiens]|uniref:Uncharacterized protein n=1 Tax=Rhypophila decipiens TaxID=261697 RepID=A0AAN6XXT5_9PEZI|nr:hypothetical protein QBC37DRAFT_458852 [Rhypophila decipiens]
MAASNPKKRFRADTLGNATVTAPQATGTERSGATSNSLGNPAQHSEADITQWLKSLDAETQQGLFTAAALRHPDVAASIKEKYDHKMAREAQKVIVFSQYSSDASYILNDKYSHLSGSKQYDKALNAGSSIEKMLRAISYAVDEHHSFGTKYNALEAIRAIFDEVISAGDTLGSEVRKNVDSSWGEYLTGICQLFDADDLDRLVVKMKEGELYLDFFAKTAKEAKGYCLDGLQMDEALDILLGGEDEEGDEDEDEDVQDEDEDDEDEDD